MRKDSPTLSASQVCKLPPSRDSKSTRIYESFTDKCLSVSHIFQPMLARLCKFGLFLLILPSIAFAADSKGEPTSEVEKPVLDMFATAEAKRVSVLRPTTDMFISAGDNYWVDYLLALDSPASIKDSVQMWADIFGIKRVYWRGQQEEARLNTTP